MRQTNYRHNVDISEVKERKKNQKHKKQMGSNNKCHVLHLVLILIRRGEAAESLHEWAIQC